MLKSEYDNIYIKQIKRKDNVTTQQYLDIAELIYDTDKYIYPAIFGEDQKGKNNAKTILPYIFEQVNDGMFSKENLFVLLKNNRVIGLILWCKGIVEWDVNIIIEIANNNGIKLNEMNIFKVQKEYVENRYNKENGRISLINVCVRKEDRGKGIGKRLLNEFINCHYEEKMELVVLKNNTSAIRLYESFGFYVKQEDKGFSCSNEKPKCLYMERN